MSYTTAFNDATTTAFLNRLQMSLCSTAIAVANEPAATPQHAARAALARSVLYSPQTYAVMMSPGVCADQTTGAASTDAQIDARVSAVWNSYL